MKANSVPGRKAELTVSTTAHERRSGERPSEIVRRHLDYDSWVVEAVRDGEAQLDRGEFLTHAEVGRRLQRFLRT